MVLGEKLYQTAIHREVFLIALTLFSFGLGILRYTVKDFHIPSDFLEEKIGERLEFQGVVINEPEKRDNSTRFVVLFEDEKILVNTGLYSAIQYGDRVVVAGKLEKPGVIENDEEKTFDYAKYLSKDDIYYVVSFAEAETVSPGNGNVFRDALLKLKHSFVGNIQEILSEPESSLLAGLIVAGKEAMPNNILEEFRRAGVVHIVVLSGFNITIIAEFFRRFFENIFLRVHSLGQWGPRTASGASILAILAFILMTGAEPTVVRAGLMVLAVLVGKMFGRSYSASRALLVAAFLMILENPKILVFDKSFQLSFLATLALVHVAPIVEKYLKWITKKWEIRAMVATTIATQVVVLPYLIYVMGDFSTVSLPANILILPIIPATMFIGFLAGVVAYTSSSLALPLSFLSHFLLSWVLGVSNFLGNLSFASISFHLFPVWAVIIVYLLLFMLWRRLQNFVPHSPN